jgi:hypothetical protein
VRRDAVFSDDGHYRYQLTRHWDDGNLKRACFVMLNPSTADHLEDDPTIRRCISFARREGCGGLWVVNRYAWRATDPRELNAIWDPRGPDNEKHVLGAMVHADLVIVAWGTTRVQARPTDVVGLSSVVGVPPLMCLGTTKTGAPRHPLYLHSAAPLEVWRP